MHLVVCGLINFSKDIHRISAQKYTTQIKQKQTTQRTIIQSTSDKAPRDKYSQHSSLSPYTLPFLARSYTSSLSFSLKAAPIRAKCRQPLKSIPQRRDLFLSVATRSGTSLRCFLLGS
ncbi:hypothetical protein Droror1_Dr00018372 [Drosera rotundifolia]